MHLVQPMAAALNVRGLSQASLTSLPLVYNLFFKCLNYGIFYVKYASKNKKEKVGQCVKVFI